MGTLTRAHYLGLTCFAILVFSSYSSAAEGDRGPGTAGQGLPLSCLLRLRADPRNSCIPEEDGLLPDRLSELVEGNETPVEFQEAAKRNDLSSVSPARMADVPLSILLLLPLYHLSACEARALSAIVKKYPDNTAVARKVLSCLDLQDNTKRSDFIRELGMTSALSFDVQGVIGEAVVRWWRSELESATTSDTNDVAADLASVGSPLLAALPPGFLAEQTPDRAAHLLASLRNHRWREPNDWCFQPFATKRVWMELFKADKSSGRGQLISPNSEGLNMLWAGATSDEIADLQYDSTDIPSLTKLHRLTKLQARGIFNKLYPVGTLSSTELNAVVDWVQDLAPSNLQRFSVNITDFSLFPAASWSRASLATQKQILEDVVASIMVQGRISSGSNVGTWGRNMKDIGRLVHLIRATYLSNYSVNHLPLDVLAALDSYDLSAMQARYLTNKGEFVDLRMPLLDLEKLHGLTRAIPTGKLAELRDGTVQPGVFLHLLEALPAVHPARSACLFNKQRSKMHEANVFRAIVRNPNPDQYLKLVSSRELGRQRTWLESTFGSRKSRVSSAQFDEVLNYWRNIPESSLSALLGSARREIAASLEKSPRLPWTTTSLLSSSRAIIRASLIGLSCPDILGIELVDLPAIAHAYNKRRRESGKVFPKRLQHCFQRSMEDYLDMKQRINQVFPDEGLVSLLEPSDIDAFGGYVLATLNPEHIREAKHANQILSTIGSISPHEILAAVPKLERLEELASLLVDQFHAKRSLTARTLFALGSLHMFLPAATISAVEPASWKLFVESWADEPRSLLSCAGEEQRDAWHRLAVAAFGSADSWSAGVLVALGDLLGVMPSYVLEGIRNSAWRDAADTLALRTAYHLPVEVPGRDDPVPFMEACKSLLPENERLAYELSVRRLLRYYLTASQALLDQVTPAEQLVRRLKQRSFRAHIDYAVASELPPTQRPTTSDPSTSPPSSTSTSTTTTINFFESWFAPVDTTTTTDGPPTSTTTAYVEWENFFATEASWLETPQPTVANPPDTVMVLGDPSTHWPSVDETTTVTVSKTSNSTLNTTRTPTERPTTDEPLTASGTLVPWQEGARELGLESSLSRTEVSTSESPASVPEQGLSTARPALDLPTLDLEGSDKSNTSVSVNDTADSASDKSASRRRRDASDELDEQLRELARNVHLQVTCDAVRALGSAAWLALVPSDAEPMMDVEAEDCAEVFAKLPLDGRFAAAVWRKIPPAARSDIIGDLGSLVGAMTEEDVADLNLDLKDEHCLDTLSVIGENVKDQYVVRAVTERFAEQNPSAAIQNGVDPDSVLVALGPMVCELPLDQLRMLLARRGSLLHAMQSLNEHLQPCHMECLRELARAAVTEAALGSPSNWTAEDVRDMGVIVAGLDVQQLEQLKRPLNSLEQPLSGLSAKAVTCMTPGQLQAIGDQLSVVSPVAAAAVTIEQRHALNAGQEVVLLRVRNLAFTRLMGRREPGLHEFTPSAGGSACVQSSYLIFVISMFSLVINLRTA